ncbi:MAG: lysophospholipid acyltransferase family protein [Myxococcota bacterium]|nr:lysophospholipid acyltransferase family protein [Myxococcota bacterium]
MASGSSNSTGRSRRLSRSLHALQLAIVTLAAPLWVPLAAGCLRLVGGYSVRNLGRARAEFDGIWRETDDPLMLCGNHLTLIDSFLIMWVLRSPWRLLTDPKSFAWNTPERTNFARSPLYSALTYFAKCIPITRGGRREDTGLVLDRVVHLLERGELALLFPEGGRSRSGRVDPAAAAWGVGRVIGALPNCRVLCIFLRGDAQQSWGRFPARGDTLTVEMSCIEPKSDYRGARRSRDLARQVTAQLAKMEEEYFDGRQ